MKGADISTNKKHKHIRKHKNMKAHTHTKHGRIHTNRIWKLQTQETNIACILAYRGNLPCAK